ncbi:MAG: tRNA (N6-isopentenyl adenosine(37)-C2)-methylthiotransferase MiaB [Phycisphaerae bacterium]|nr:MAG: tRNA (N6-isopentenyl adenosine(37)-C2)-methylthiotransferase MiaB [Planctomycetota bacterium]KAB2940015.1 MAG: tRNA (N6-isopentenyl adenosine(37)-C2)-methylthiotransferase MiaB [Phycisphaerae bacterium]MCK6465386.1 tRNA (N6-isopentenyl adenosine(37)-C2)-methylthiotransferase MiaB [Phycisphaerae bacterium]MCL4718597.1 tRNA (N6-isopentenyl adenosine(37)-C2)-methylthiotransferase MiaB [Phycisphaerae bacterium]MCQ3921344.1 tRNA (N6-isopentenyl adenosine(37)-C2)-methylthiotransferase MiaB [P
MTAGRLYIETLGCQMNMLDSELVEGQLRRLGYETTADMQAADVVLINTCSVRDHAEQKALSHLGALKKRKAKHPDTIVGVIGCMAERDPDGIVSKMPHVDLICGPGELNKVPAMIEEIREHRTRAVALSQSLSRRSTPLQRALEYDSVEALDLSRDPAPGAVLQAYIRVQRGCDKFCTFCVVPFTRGAERSRPASSIVEEAKKLADRGCKEVTLVGQTVNSYVHQEDGRPVRFADLLERVNDVSGLERVRFVTSYPGDFTDDVLDAMRELPKVCEYLHLPAQSGSDAVLKRMRRMNTVPQYVELVERAREKVPGITLASDFIVGFCGETEEEFEDTVRLVERCRFKNLFVFKYSPRPGTVADKRLEDDVPEAVKRERNMRLLKLQERLSFEDNQKLIGRSFEVLVEGYSKAAIKAQESEQDRGCEVDRGCEADRGVGAGAAVKADTHGHAPPARRPREIDLMAIGASSHRSFADAVAGADLRTRVIPETPGDDEPHPPHARPARDWRRANQLVGRTRTDRIVVFSGAPNLIGALVNVRVHAATALTLHGEVVG